jgi:hypothetical protein
MVLAQGTCAMNIVWSLVMNVSDATILSITLKLSIMLLEASFMLLDTSFTTFIVRATVATIVNYDHNMLIVQATRVTPHKNISGVN